MAQPGHIDLAKLRNLSRERKKVNTSVLRRGDGRPSDKLHPVIPTRVSVLPAPLYNRDVTAERHLYEEQQVCRVADLMVKGFRKPAHLMKLLDLPDYHAVERYMKRVIARWEIEGAKNEHAAHRGEALERLDVIEQELWAQIFAGSPAPDANRHVNLKAFDTRGNIAALRVLADIASQRAEIQGLTTKVIERLGVLESEAPPLARRMDHQDRMAGLASAMLELLEKRTPAAPMKTIEHAREG